MATLHGVVGLVESGSWVRGRVETSALQFRQITLRRALRMPRMAACPALRDAAEAGTPWLGGSAPQGGELPDRLEAADRQAVVVVARR